MTVERTGYIEVEGDKHKVAPTREYFAAIYAGLSIAEEYAREMRLELETERAARVRAEEALHRIAYSAGGRFELIETLREIARAALAAIPEENR